MWHDTVEELASSVRRYALQGRGRGRGSEDVLAEIEALEQLGVFELVSSGSLEAAAEGFPYVVAVGRELFESPAAPVYWSATAARLLLASAQTATGQAPDEVESLGQAARCGVSLAQQASASCTATPEDGTSSPARGSSWRASGELSGLLGLEGAQRILLTARLSGAAPGSDWGLLAVGVSPSHISAHGSWSGDALSSVRFDGQAGVLLAAGDEPSIKAMSESALSAATVLQCADLLALARCSLTRTIEHLRQRQQFGRALASLPVVRSHLADAEIHLSVAEAVTGVALASLSRGMASGMDGHPAVATAALVARLSVQKRIERAILIANRLTGGVGYYDDYALAGLTRSVMVRSRMFGSYSDLRALTAALLEESDVPPRTSEPMRNARHLSAAGNRGHQR